MQASLSIYLDLIRYLAAMTVFVGHAAGRQWTGGLLWQAGYYGQTAVMIFFVLSGFVIAHVVATREQSVPEFAATRLARLWSVVLPALVLTFAIDWVGVRVAPEIYVDKPWYHGDHAALRYLASAFFVNDFWGGGLTPGVNGPFWSISYEFAYYVMFGVLVLVPSRPWAWALAAIGALLCGPTIMALFPVWLLGVLAQRLTAKPRLGQATAWLLYMGSLAVLLGSPKWRELLGKTGLPFIHRDAILGDYVDGLAFFGHLIAFGSLAPAFEAGLLRWRRPIVYLASTAFAMYLFHRPLLQFATYISPGEPQAWLRRLLVFVGVPVAVALMTPSTDRLKREMRTRLLVGLRALLPARAGTGDRA